MLPAAHISPRSRSNARSVSTVLPRVLQEDRARIVPVLLCVFCGVLIHDHADAKVVGVDPDQPRCAVIACPSCFGMLAPDANAAHPRSAPEQEIRQHVGEPRGAGLRTRGQTSRADTESGLD